MVDATALLLSFKSTHFVELRPEQARALDHLLGDERQPDLVLDLPTGAGKTLVGLLAAAESMKNGSSAVYLTGNRALANQVAREALKLNLPADVFSAPLAEVSAVRRMRVNDGRTLGVMNYWAYFAEPTIVDPPGLLVFDDAHLAESAFESKYGLTLDVRDQRELVRSVFDEIERWAPDYPPIRDTISGEGAQSSLTYVLAFGDVSVFAPHVKELLDPILREHPNLKYPWKRVRDELTRMLWLAGPNGLQIRPVRYPLTGDRAFSEAGRRLYLSATIGDLTDLRRRLGSPRLLKVSPNEAGDMVVPGHRFLVFPDDEVKWDEWATRETLWSATPRTVWFCRSRSEADEVERELGERGANVLQMDREGNALASFESQEAAHLVVAGRYDGMDFSGEAARLAIFPSAPWGINPFDEFIAANFPQAGFVRERIADRITQAFGRLTRSDDDWAVVLVEDARLANQLSSRGVYGNLPDRLRDEVFDAMERAAEGPAPSIAEAQRLLTGEDTISAAPASRRTEATPDSWSQESAQLEANIGDALTNGTYLRAISHSDRLLGHIGDHVMRPWWLYVRGWAEHLSAQATGSAEMAQKAATHVEQAVLAAGPTAWFGRVEASLRRLRQTMESSSPAASGFARITDRFPAEAKYVAWKRAISEGLASGSHSEVCAAWTNVGQALGYVSTRPGGPGATDSLWRGDGFSFVWEAKIEHQDDTQLSRRDVGQLLGQIAEEKATGNVVRGAFLTHVAEFHADVRSMADGVALVPLPVAETIWHRVETALDEFRRLRALGQAADHTLPVSSWLEQFLDHCLGRPATDADLDGAWG